jgi:hypothetical protein
MVEAKEQEHEVKPKGRNRRLRLGIRNWRRKSMSRNRR